ELTAEQVDAPGDSSWLVFLDACGVGAGLSERLREKHFDVITVSSGEKFVRLSERQYVINPNQRLDYSALARGLRDSGKTPGKIVHFWSVLPDQARQLDRELFDTNQELGFYSLVFLAQALEEENLAGAIQMTVVSNNLHCLSGKGTVCPEKATLLAPCIV